MLKDEIKKLRLAQGMTQADLAEKLDISPQAVQRWEAGKAQPSAEKIPALAKFFNVSPEALAEVANASIRDEVRKKKLIVTTSTAAATVAAGLAINALGLPAPAMGAIVGILGVAFGRLRYALNKGVDEDSFNPERDLNDAEKKQIEQVLETFPPSDKQNITPIQAVTYVLEHWDEATKNAPSPKEERGISNIQFDNIDYKVYSFSVYNYSLMRGEEYPTMDSRAGNCFHTTEKLSGLDKDRPPFIVDQDKDFRMKRTANFEPTDRILVDPLQTKIESGKIYLVSYQGESIVCQIRKNSEGQYQLINDGQPINATLDDLTARRLIVVGKVVSRWTEYYTG